MQSPVLTFSMQSKKESLRSFVVYQKKKFAMHGFCADHLKGNGRPSVPGRKIAQVKRLMNNKERRSTRSVSKRVGVSQTSVERIMKKYGYKAYHKYKVQKMSDEHKERRVECASMFLCRHLMASLPHRLQAVIDKEGRQIQKEDH